MLQYFPSMQIAIDGPVATGKGTVAKLLAQKLNWLYVDTGAMYRAITLLALRSHVDLNDAAAIAKLAAASDIKMLPNFDGRIDTSGVKLWLNGEDITEAIREPAVGSQVHIVAALRPVREILVEKQQQIANENDVVMEGRDITYRVLPHADLKIFLTADESERVERRYKQYQLKGQAISYEEAEREIRERDHLDTTRETDPLKIVDDAWVLDTTNMSIDEELSTITNKWAEITTNSQKSKQPVSSSLR